MFWRGGQVRPAPKSCPDASATARKQVRRRHSPPRSPAATLARGQPPVCHLRAAPELQDSPNRWHWVLQQWQLCVHSRPRRHGCLTSRKPQISQDRSKRFPGPLSTSRSLRRRLWSGPGRRRSVRRRHSSLDSPRRPARRNGGRGGQNQPVSQKVAVAVTPSWLLLLMVLMVLVVAVFWMMGTGTRRSSSGPGCGSGSAKHGAGSPSPPMSCRGRNNRPGNPGPSSKTRRRPPHRTGPVPVRDDHQHRPGQSPTLHRPGHPHRHGTRPHHHRHTIRPRLRHHNGQPLDRPHRPQRPRTHRRSPPPRPRRARSSAANAATDSTTWKSSPPPNNTKPSPPP